MVFITAAKKHEFTVVKAWRRAFHITEHLSGGTEMSWGGQQCWVNTEPAGSQENHFSPPPTAPPTLSFSLFRMSKWEDWGNALYDVPILHRRVYLGCDVIRMGKLQIFCQ